MSAAFAVSSQHAGWKWTANHLGNARLLFFWNDIPQNYGDCSDGFYSRFSQSTRRLETPCHCHMLPWASPSWNRPIISGTRFIRWSVKTARRNLKAALRIMTWWNVCFRPRGAADELYENQYFYKILEEILRPVVKAAIKNITKSGPFRWSYRGEKGLDQIIEKGAIVWKYTKSRLHSLRQRSTIPQGFETRRPGIWKAQTLHRRIRLCGAGESGGLPNFELQHEQLHRTRPVRWERLHADCLWAG